MRKIALCDDEKFALHVISGAIEKVFIKYQPKIYRYHNLEQLEKAIATEKFDLLFLDIHFSNVVSGIDFARKLRERNDNIGIIFISGHESRVFEAFEVQPICFIRKSSFLKDLERYAPIINKKLEKESEENFMIHTSGKMELVKVNEIVYVEGALKKQCVYTIDNTCYEVTKTMKQLEKELSDHNFIRIHSGYIVNCAHIKSLNNNEIVLKNGSILPISRSRLKDVKQNFFDYIGRRNK